MSRVRLDVFQFVTSILLLGQCVATWYVLAVVLKLRYENAVVVYLLAALSASTPMGTLLAWVVNLWGPTAATSGLYRPYLWINGVLICIAGGYIMFAASHGSVPGYKELLVILIVGVLCWFTVLSVYLSTSRNCSDCAGGAQQHLNDSGSIAMGAGADNFWSPMGGTILPLCDRATQTDPLLPANFYPSLHRPSAASVGTYPHSHPPLPSAPPGTYTSGISTAATNSTSNMYEELAMSTDTLPSRIYPQTTTAATSNSQHYP